MNIFDEIVQNINTSQKETQAYINSTLSKYITVGDHDLSKESIVLIFNRAKTKYSFKLFQDTADWIFFTRIFFPEKTNQQLYSAIAQNSYYRCYIILNKQWKLYEELSDNFNYLTEAVQTSVHHFQKKALQDEKLFLVL